MHRKPLAPPDLASISLSPLDISPHFTRKWAGTFAAAMFALGLDHTGPVEIVPPDGKDQKWLMYKFECGVELYVGGVPRGEHFEIGPRYETAKGNVPGLTWQPPKHLLERDYKGSGGLPGDFLYCVKTREKPFRDVEYAHRVATVCHLGNIAYEL